MDGWRPPTLFLGGGYRSGEAGDLCSRLCLEEKSAGLSPDHMLESEWSDGMCHR